MPGLSVDPEAAEEEEGCAFTVKEKMRDAGILKRERDGLDFIGCIWFSEPVAELQPRNRPRQNRRESCHSRDIIFDFPGGIAQLVERLVRKDFCAFVTAPDLIGRCWTGADAKRIPAAINLHNNVDISGRE